MYGREKGDFFGKFSFIHEIKLFLIELLGGSGMYDVMHGLAWCSCIKMYDFQLMHD